MKRIALLLAGLALGMTSPAMADAWAPGGPVALAAKGLQLAQNDDSQRGKREPARAGRDERGESKAQRDAPQQREAPPQPDRREGRQPGVRQAPDPREAYDRRGPGRPEAPVAPQAYGPPRVSEQSAIASVRQRYPGGRVMNSSPVIRNGRTYYQVRVQTRSGELVDVLIDGGG